MSEQSGVTLIRRTTLDSRANEMLPESFLCSHAGVRNHHEPARAARWSDRVGAVAATITGVWLCFAGLGGLVGAVFGALSPSNSAGSNIDWRGAAVVAAGTISAVGGIIVVSSTRRIWYGRRYHCVGVAMIAFLTAAISLVGLLVVENRALAVLLVASWTLFSDPANHRSMCKRHHDQKTAKFDGGFGREAKDANAPVPVGEPGKLFYSGTGSISSDYVDRQCAEALKLLEGK